MSDFKTSKRRGLILRFWFRLKRPVIFKLATVILNLFTLLVRVLDLFK